MIHVFLTLITIPLVLTGTLGAAQAVPTCGSDVLASYIAFGAEGCNFGHVNFSNFVYAGQNVNRGSHRAP